MIDLRDLHKFERLTKGAGLKLNGGRYRSVRLEVNCSDYTVFESGGVFLANVIGREALVFYVPEGGAVVKARSDGEVFVWTNELSDGAAVMVDAESFTKPAVRRERNPQLEAIMRKMQENGERRMRRALGEMEARLLKQPAPVAVESKPNGKPKAKSAAAAPDVGGGDGAQSAAGDGGSASAAEPAGTSDAGTS